MTDQLTPDMLRRLLRYEPETGKLFWRERPVELFATIRASKTWNTRFAGKEAFTSIGKNGYRHGNIFDHTYTAHRVIWAMVYGYWPEHEVDHDDTVRTNNRLNNLRKATHHQNARNRGKAECNTSGFKGVSWHKGAGKWMARIRAGAGTHYLGLFASPEEAHQSYCAAARRLHGDFYNDGTNPLNQGDSA